MLHCLQVRYKLDMFMQHCLSILRAIGELDMVRTREKIKMNLNKATTKIIAIALVSTTMLAGCTTQDHTGNDSSGKASTGKRELTVITGDKPIDNNQEIAVERIHRLDGANIEKWLSNGELEIMVTTPRSKATATKEATFNYNWFKVNLDNNERQEIKPTEQDKEQVIKTSISPDGKYSFIQTWRDKYTAENKIVNQATGESIDIEVDNYLEVGGWLNDDTYILAAGSMQGRGDIWQITIDGSKKKIELQDKDVEFLQYFGVGGGFIYYMDANQQLKRFSPTALTPTVLAKQVSEFRLSPNHEQIAVSTIKPGAEGQSDLVLYDTEGNVQGLFIGKGDLISYSSWSPDSTKLAFAVYSENPSGMNGVYIFDSVTGKVSPLGLSSFPTYPLSWNPDGTRLGVTADGANGVAVTQIVDFK